MNTFYEKLHSSDFFDCPKCGAEVCIRDIVNGKYYCKNCHELISKYRARKLGNKHLDENAIIIEDNRFKNQLDCIEYHVDCIEAASLAQNAYGTSNINRSLYGWKEIYTDLRLDDSQTGLRSVVYSKIVNGIHHYVYAFAGTKGIDPRDWVSNFTQLIGMSPQHNLAVDNAKVLCQQYGIENITFVGHSLGGGLAALCSMVTGAKAITFNAANVNYITKTRHFSFSEKNIDAYIMITDPLNLGQKFLGNDLILDNANGNIHYVVPSKIYLDPLKHHSIEAMIESLQNQ